MKTRILLLLLTATIQSGLHAQNIGINATGERPDSSAILDIKSDSKGLLIPRMTLSQLFSIRNPSVGLTAYLLDVDPGYYVFDGTVWARLARASENAWFTYSDGSIVKAQFGSVGINTTGLPKNSLQIGDDGGFVGYDLAIGRNSQAMAIYQGPNFTNWSATDNISINPKGGAGYVGINVGSNPSNKLQIGSVGATGFATNDLAIGNGTNAFAIFQTDASTLMGSTTDMVLKPRNNGHGRVGINTDHPRAPLDVTDVMAVSGIEYTYVNGLSGVSHDEGGGGGLGFCPNCTAQVSIVADNAVLAKEFDAFSDARIKDIIGETNSTRDLATLNALQVTDYTMKDKISSGNRPYKKVIAQQVESVYPQVVKKHTDFIPNVYQVSSRVDKVGDNYLLTFSKAHQIGSGASVLRLVSDSSGMQQAEILGIPNSTQVLIHLAHAPNLGLGKTFVYGEQVDDFRTVDYEGLTALHISATQELAKLVKAQQARIDELQMLLEEQEGRIDLQEQLLDRLERKLAAPAPGSK